MLMFELFKLLMQYNCYMNDKWIIIRNNNDMQINIKIKRIEQIYLLQ